jgi:hypothetical protein
MTLGKKMEDFCGDFHREIYIHGTRGIFFHMTWRKKKIREDHKICLFNNSVLKLRALTTDEIKRTMVDHIKFTVDTS